MDFLSNWVAVRTCEKTFQKGARPQSRDKFFFLLFLSHTFMDLVTFGLEQVMRGKESLRETRQPSFSGIVVKAWDLDFRTCVYATGIKQARGLAFSVVDLREPVRDALHMMLTFGFLWQLNLTTRELSPQVEGATDLANFVKKGSKWTAYSTCSVS